jgi:hypothetical protein
VINRAAAPARGELAKTLRASCCAKDAIRDARNIVARKKRETVAARKGVARVDNGASGIILGNLIRV